jgi:hypothetical protein
MLKCLHDQIDVNVHAYVDDTVIKTKMTIPSLPTWRRLSGLWDWGYPGPSACGQSCGIFKSPARPSVKDSTSKALARPPPREASIGKLHQAPQGLREEQPPEAPRGRTLLGSPPRLAMHVGDASHDEHRQDRCQRARTERLSSLVLREPGQHAGSQGSPKGCLFGATRPGRWLGRTEVIVEPTCASWTEVLQVKVTFS